MPDVNTQLIRRISSALSHAAIPHTLDVATGQIVFIEHGPIYTVLTLAETDPVAFERSRAKISNPAIHFCDPPPMEKSVYGESWTCPWCGKYYELEEVEPGHVAWMTQD